MSIEELFSEYNEDICKLCHERWFISRSHPETLCEGNWCDEAVHDYAEEHNIDLED